MTSDTTPTSTTHDDPTAETADATGVAPAELGGEQAGVAPTARKAKGVKSFADVGVHPDLVEALTAKGFDAPFPIQELTLPIATKGHDVIGQARTGTGKTLAFGLALLGRVTPGGGTQALVIVPTRELCIQVADELQIGKARGLRVIAVYGGVGYEEQEAAFDGGHEVVVGTPGRLLDHVNKRNLDLSGVTELVLDEADEMLDMGFLPDVERLIQACRDDRHGMLFSATMPTEVVKLARRYLDHPTFMRADTEALETAPNVEQHFFEVHRMDKPRVLARILQSPERGGVYVFVRTKHMADRLVRELEDLGTAAIAIHGDLRQSMREKNLDKFRDGSATVLVATEVAARGLDVENVTHVINYDCPDDDKMYLHRIGRTARAGAKGVAITFCEFNEVDRLNVIRKKVGAVDQAVVPVFSPSEILTERFDLPAERPWDAQVAGSKAGTRTDRRKPDADGDKGRGGGRGDDRGRGGRGDKGRGDGGRGDKGRGSGRGDSGRNDGRSDEGRGDGGRGGRGGRDEGRDPSPTTEARTDDTEAAVDEPVAKDGNERRTNRTDGRPKSSRRAEGGGRDRDGNRDRRDRAAREERPDDATARDAEGGGSATTAREGEGSRSAPAERTGTDDGGARTRTRARTRARSTDRSDRAPATERRDADRDRPDRSRSGGDGDGQAADGGSTGDRRPDAGSRGGDGDRPRGGARARGRQSRARTSEGPGGGDAAAAGGASRSDTGDRERSSGGRERSSGGRERSSGGRSSDGRDQKRDGGGGGQRRGKRGGRDGGNRDGRGRDGGGNRDGGGRGGRDGGRDNDATVATAPRGREARGEGAPALARRVKVEHLP